MRASYNLGDLFEPTRPSERIALIDCRNWDAPESYSYGRLDERANACARGLLKRRLKRGSAVAILAANRAEFLISYLGVMRAGLLAVPVNFRFPQATIDYIMRDASIAFVVYGAEYRTCLPAAIPAAGWDCGDRSW